MMRAASPWAREIVGCEPAGISATTRRLRGAAAAAFTTSTARTANPSIEELSKRGDHSLRQCPQQAHGLHTRPVEEFRLLPGEAWKGCARALHLRSAKTCLPH